MKENTKPEIELANLLAIHADASNEMATLQIEADDQMLLIADAIQKEYMTLQNTISAAEEALYVICLQHPELFGTKQSISTPSGKVAFRRTPVLDIHNEELTIALIQKHNQVNGTLDVSKLIRTREELNREGLEALDDATLGKLKVKRVIKETFKVTPAKMDLGKVMARAIKAETKAA